LHKILVRSSWTKSSYRSKTLDLFIIPIVIFIIIGITD
jgi:hypothetical protein